MAELGKEESDGTELQSRRGFKRYAHNPSVPNKHKLSSTRMRPVRIPHSDKGMLFADGSTGELIGSGVRHFFKFEEVDASRFVKLYLDGMKQAAGLSKADVDSPGLRAKRDANTAAARRRPANRDLLPAMFEH